ncbi:phosphotransferase family protein [Aspergillus campestris IBT 28561]|uniref:Phosphotransferase family protein n=1 Tax=Aspergillus campestris (strain IBT 28561) TaxID=1392248 RepID=A0A2I1D0V8_ASPC2|nr:phosphotransferase family protein [Aspergillus campestris IBT 28561]PKY03497.1 phosphotransferase family protein [Aspergillus campestris IBT 28561]
MDDDRRLFDYTSGRWIYNENARLAERRGEFDVDALRNAAARSIRRRDTDVKSLVKLAEGGFNRVLQVTMVDNSQVLARLPYPSTEPKRLAVASEVATLALLRAHGLPVPRVHAYSIDATNPKLPGRPLGAAWFDLSEQQRLKVLLQLVQIEAKLQTIELPVSGSIYYDRDLPADAPRIAIPDSEFCIGPSTALKWWFKERATLPINRGPYVNAVDVLRAPALKEITWLQEYGRPRFPFQRAYRESMDYRLSQPSDHIRSLEAYLELAPKLLPSDGSLDRPLLRHPDLQPNNIFVSDDLDIVGLIDWQHASVLPLFLTAGIPKYFQNYEDPKLLAFRPPPRPDLSGLDDEEKADVLEDFRCRHIHFFYLAFTQPWHESSSGPCPISFPSAEADDIMRLQDMQEEVDLQLKRIRSFIGVGVDGWTDPDNYEAACFRSRQMRNDGLASLNTEHEREMTGRHWPFNDHDEDE